ncbi:MAG: T9SS type A sorting domain-containing protein, partial [Syntrophothermus sp.]
KCFHVKVWKPRISPLKMKIQGGAAGDLEIFSTNTQTQTMKWEDFVFDFSAKTGMYPIFTFMPDFQDPITTTKNDTIYFDDFILNNYGSPYTGIPKYQEDGRVLVYPVPCNDYLNIRTLLQVGSVSITNIAGQQVYRSDRSFKEFTSISMTNLAPGMYFVTVTPESGQPYLFRIMKK